MLVVIPARGGSKRVPRKNIALLCGRPLLAWTADLIADSGLVEDTVVSTEDDEIASVALACGLSVIRRPQELATDTSSTESVLLHVLDTLRSRGRVDEWIMTLPPTSPLRSSATVRRFVDLSSKCPADVDCLASMTENRGDFWFERSGLWSRLFPDAPRRQQDRAPLWEENSALYLTRVSALSRTGSILGSKILGVPVSAVEGFDINNVDDFLLAEALLVSRIDSVGSAGSTADRLGETPHE